MCCAEISEIWTARPCRLKAGDFFDCLGSRSFAFLYGDGPRTRYLILGEDPLLVAEDLRGPFPVLRRSGDLPPIFPDFIGHVSYEAGGRLGALLPPPAPKPFPFPDCHLALHRKLRLYDRETEVLYTAQREGVAVAEPENSLGEEPFRARKVHESDTPATYRDKVLRIREEIARGNVYQVNLTRQERWAYRGDLRLFARRLHDLNPAPFSAFIAGGGFTIVSSSPERFFQVQDGRILASPIKGTSPRADTAAEDALLKRDLSASPKNRAELAMITDLLRNDLTRVCLIPSVRVEAFPRLETYANVHHLVADISGDLVPGATLETLAGALFPGGSVTGSPKLASMGLIRELEPWPRMAYTGALGWFSHDFRQADFSIAIRTVWASPAELAFGVGGGVVWDSDPAEEYQETLHKGSSLVRCLNS
jgi:para-aminobenzoate synthetase component 1